MASSSCEPALALALNPGQSKPWGPSPGQSQPGSIPTSLGNPYIALRVGLRSRVSLARLACGRRRGGASLLVLVTAVALPLQQLVLCARPMVGKWAETFFWGDAVALVLVLAGFAIYQGAAPEGQAARQRGRRASHRS